MLGVTAKTIQNWEQGVSRIPYAAFKLLRVLRGHELPDAAWQGWTVEADRLKAPNGREFDAASLNHLEQVFSMARLWRDAYARSGRQKPPSVVIPFPDLRKPLEAPPVRPDTSAKRRRG